MRRALGWAGRGLLFLAIGAMLLFSALPFFLDRIYYRGPVSGHFDGARFFNPDGEDTGSRPPGGRSRAGFLTRWVTGTDERAPWPDTVAVAQARPAQRIDGNRMVATWVGHATLLIQTQGLNILTDPIWSDTAGPFGFGPRRVTRPGIRFEDLPRIDLVVVSHNHYDHMDLATLKRLWDRDRPRIVTSLGNDTILRGAGIEATALDWGRRLTLANRCGIGMVLPDSHGGRCPPAAAVSVAVTRNHHWGSRWFADRNRALWSSFTLILPGGNVFFAGDTGMGDGRWPDEAAKLGPVRLAAIPIGAFRFEPGGMAIGSHIGPVDAVEVYRRLGAPMAIPIHWGTFRLSFEARDTPPGLLRAATACTGQAGFDPQPMGVPIEVPAVTMRPVLARPIMTRDTLLRCLDTPAVRALK